MSLADKLAGIDESLWKLHGKITEKSMKTIGWDKYDLAKASSNVASVASLAGATFLGIDAYENYSPSSLILSLGFLGITYGAKDIHNVLEKIEKKTDELSIKSGEIRMPKFNGARPFVLYGDALYLSLNTFLTFNLDKTPNFGLAAGLGHYAGGLVTPLLISTTYFLTQPPPPANKEPSLLDRLKEGVSDFIHKPKAVPIKYQLNDLSTYASQIGGLLG